MTWPGREHRPKVYTMISENEVDVGFLQLLTHRIPIVMHNRLTCGQSYSTGCEWRRWIPLKLLHLMHISLWWWCDLSILITGHAGFDRGVVAVGLVDLGHGKS